MRLSGFESDGLQTLSDKVVSELKFNSFLAFAGIFLSGVSVAYLVGFCTGSWLMALLSGLIIVILMIALQVLVLTTTGYELNKEISELDHWRPTIWRFVIFILMFLILSQPLLLFIHDSFNPNEIKNLLIEEKLLHKEFFENSLKNQEDLLHLEVAQQDELLSQLHSKKQSGSSNILAPISTRYQNLSIQSDADPRRKALVIGNQSYKSYPLNNPVKDANDLANKLSSMGFNVTLLTDGSRKDMEIALEKYIQTIHAGDISLLYFSGHGFQDHGNNYLLPLDFTDFVRSKAIGLNLTIESISRQSPQANIVIIDACRSFSKNASGGLAATEAGLNTYIALASKPGQTAGDGPPGTNGIFTKSILSKIANPTDIDNIFRDVRKEVAESTANKQETWTAHNLSGRLILLSPDRMGINTQNQFHDASVPVSHNDHRLSFCESSAAKMSGDAQVQFIERCSKAVILRLQDDLDEHAALTSQEVAKIDKELLNPEHGPAELLTAFYSLWSHPKFSIVGTILITLILAYGFFIRDMFPANLREYERSMYYKNRSFITRHFEKMNNVVENLKYAPKIMSEYGVDQPFQNKATLESNLNSQRFDRKAYEKLFKTLTDRPVGVIL
jgi:hypothetical protein